MPLPAYAKDHIEAVNLDSPISLPRGRSHALSNPLNFAPPTPPPKKSNLACLSLTFTSSKNEKSVQKGILSTTFSSVSPLPLINPSLRFHDKAKTWFGHCLPIGYQLPVLPCYTFKSNFISLSNAVFNSKSQDLRKYFSSFYYFRVELSFLFFIGSKIYSISCR